MKWDLSDVDEVPAWHADWFVWAVTPHMRSATEGPEQVQDAAIRVWVQGPHRFDDEEHTGRSRSKWLWDRAMVVVKQHTKPRSQKRERMYADWSYAWMEAERYDGSVVGVVDPADSLHERMLLDAPPALRDFLVAWAIERLTVEEAARTVGVSRATGYRWRDELVDTLQVKWGQ